MCSVGQLKFDIPALRPCDAKLKMLDPGSDMRARLSVEATEGLFALEFSAQSPPACPSSVEEARWKLQALLHASGVTEVTHVCV